MKQFWLRLALAVLTPIRRFTHWAEDVVDRWIAWYDRRARAVAASHSAGDDTVLYVVAAILFAIFIGILLAGCIGEPFTSAEPPELDEAGVSVSPGLAIHPVGGDAEAQMEDGSPPEGDDAAPDTATRDAQTDAGVHVADASRDADARADAGPYACLPFFETRCGDVCIATQRLDGGACP